jgi:hypothetical protein
MASIIESELVPIDQLVISYLLLLRYIQIPVSRSRKKIEIHMLQVYH